MTWKVTADDTTLLPGESTALHVTTTDPATEDRATVELVDGPGATVSGETLKVLDPPTSPRASARLRDINTKATLDEVAVDVLLPWEADGPRLVDALPGITGVKSWDDEKGRRAKLIAHDVLQQLPDAFLRELRGLPVIRMDSGFGGEYKGGPFANEHVYIGDGDVTPLDATAPQITEADRKFATLLVHELAHAWLGRKCGGGFGTGLRGLSTAVQILAGAAVHPAIVVACFFPPAFVYVAAVGIALTVEHAMVAPDTMSSFAMASGWRQNNLSTLTVPILGVFTFLTAKEPPNAGTALASQADLAGHGWAERILNVNNNDFDVYAVQAATRTGPGQGGYFKNPDAAEPLLKPTPPPDGPYAIGVPSPYGAISPFEDLAEMVAGHALKLRGPDWPASPVLKEKGAVPSDPYFQANTRPAGGWTRGKFYREPSAARTKWLADQGLYDKSQPGVVVGAGPQLSKLSTLVPPDPTAPAGAPATAPWRIQSIPVDDEALQAAAEELQANGAASEVSRLWNEGPAESWRRADAAVEEIGRSRPIQQRKYGLLAALECHGEGLGRIEARGEGAEDGDVVLSADAAVRVVARAEEDGIRALIGNPGEEKGVAATVPVDELGLKRRWAPDPTPRVFSSGDDAPAYGDLEKTLRNLIDLWGLSAREKRDLDSLAGFSGVLAEELALPDPPKLKLDRSGAGDTIARLSGLGRGLQPYDPAEPVHVGDVVVDFTGNTLGVVTRVDADGRPVDLLAGGSTTEGELAEDAGAVRMEHEIDHLDVRYVWRPDTKERTFDMPDDHGGTLTDPQRALRHVVAHTGAERLTRREDSIFLTDPLAILAGLLVEGEPDPQVRRALGLKLEGDADTVLEHLVAHGVVRSRGAVQAGDLLVLGEEDAALVLEAADGKPTQVARIGKTLEVAEPELAPERIALAWAPSHADREVEVPEQVDAFYGGIGELLRMPARYRDQDQVGLGLDSGKESQFLHQSDGLARVLSQKAPEWVRRRLWGADDTDTLKARCDTLGEGLVDAPEAGLAVGTWIFGRSGLKVVMATDADGRPSLVYTQGRNSGAWLFVDDGEVDGRVWVPATTPRRYTTEAGPGYQDRSVLVGLALVWGEHKYRLDAPLFADKDIAESGAFTPEAAKLLRRGPDSQEEWPEYLAGHGSVEKGAGRPGDLLLFEDPEKQAIAVDGDTMLLQTSSYGNVGLRKQAGVTGHWKPPAAG
ncbi:MAG TPA: hypothetical protein VF587_11150 [Solirubrobacteraceae bacterium]